MKVLLCNEGAQSAVAQYRLFQPAAVLEETESSLEFERVHRLPLDGAGHLLKLECDVFVFQLPMQFWAPSVIDDLHAQGIKVVVEIDDDYGALDSAHSGWAATDPVRNPLANWRHLKTSCAKADLVTASTPALLARYAPDPSRGRLLRNYVRKALLDIPRPQRSDGRTVGWYGSVGVHPNDLQVTYGGVAAAVQECGARFLCVGGGAKVKQHLSLREEPETTGWVDFELYAHLVARMDVGIVPLADTRFNEAKSWLKGLEYAALGIPFVASDVVEYRSLAERGIGSLVGPKARHWKREVKALLENDHVRLELGANARRRVRDELTIEKNAWRFAEAWQDCLDRNSVHA